MNETRPCRVTTGVNLLRKEVLDDMGIVMGYGKTHIKGMEPRAGDYAKARILAIKDLVKQASAKGADIVLGLQFVSIPTMISPTKLVIIAVGTMVIVDPNNPHFIERSLGLETDDDISTKGLTTRSSFPDAVVTEDKGFVTGFGKSKVDDSPGVLQLFVNACQELWKAARAKGANRVIGLRCTDLSGGDKTKGRVLVMTGQAVVVNCISL